jgi:aromatic ring-opening dioxygenase LigB subunit
MARLNLLLPLVTLLPACPRAAGKIVGAAVLPHGDFAFDPSLVQNQNHSVELHEGCLRVAAAVAALAPDLILLTTPHGVESERMFSFYRNSNGSGFAHLGDDLHNASFPGYDVDLNVTMDPAAVAQLSTALLLLNPNANVSTLLSFGDGEAQALRWGEVIPLTMIWEQYENTTKRSRAVADASTDSDGDPGDDDNGGGSRQLQHQQREPQLPHVVIWSVPARRYTETLSMVSSGELTALGRGLGVAAEALPQRVVVVVSADLAHTHLASGPYGFSPDAEPFDEACGVWARTLDSAALVTTALGHANNAESCGYTGLVVLDGLLQATTYRYASSNTGGEEEEEVAEVASRWAGLRGFTTAVWRRPAARTDAATETAHASAAAGATSAWNASVIVGPFHPTYYGMMTVFFERLDTTRW